MARLNLRIELDDGTRLGPGRVRLLELIGERGSISAAGRAMGMSYRRAWLHVDGLRQAFGAPAVETRLGGAGGGGARLTPLGRSLIRRYREIERAAGRAVGGQLDALERAQRR